MHTLEERTWECEPLLIVDSKDAVVFHGHTLVRVSPHSDQTADLIADEVMEGGQPNLVNAKVRGYDSSGYMQGIYVGGSRAGLCCEGCDKEGAEFTWYINGAADDHAKSKLELATIPTPDLDEPGVEDPETI